MPFLQRNKMMKIWCKESWVSIAKRIKPFVFLFVFFFMTIMEGENSTVQIANSSQKCVQYLLLLAKRRIHFYSGGEQWSLCHQSAYAGASHACNLAKKEVKGSLVCTVYHGKNRMYTRGLGVKCLKTSGISCSDLESESRAIKFSPVVLYLYTYIHSGKLLMMLYILGRLFLF